MERRIVHVDMDAFFAAVEQRDDSALKGRPVIIGASPEKGQGRGVVSTCSYEARKYGVHSAMPVSRAWRLCPQGVYLHPDIRKYAQESKKIMSLLETFSPVIEQISIDEAFLDCTGTEALFGGSCDLGKAIKQKIYKERGLSASVGIASNKSVAKIASDLQKPGGLVICPSGEEAVFLAPLSVKRLWGAGPKTVAALRRLGIETIGELAAFPEETLSRHFGRWGEHLHRMALGIDPRSLEKERGQKSISEERTFRRDTRDKGRIEQLFLALSQNVTAQLRVAGQKARTAHLKVRYSDFSTLTRSRTLSCYFDDTETLHQVVKVLFEGLKGEKRIRLIGVGVTNIEEGAVLLQPSLFDEDPTSKRKVDTIMDEVSRKHGKVITRGGLITRKEDDGV